MKLWLIRHAVAVEADRFEGPDAMRPLTPGGEKQARTFFKRLHQIYPAPGVVWSSEAVRARQTAEFFCRAFDLPSPTCTPLLNPGASFATIRELAASQPADTARAVFVGHEPDFSEAVNQWTAHGHLQLRLRKCGLIELDLRPNRPPRLTMLLPPKTLGASLVD